MLLVDCPHFSVTVTLEVVAFEMWCFSTYLLTLLILKYWISLLYFGAYVCVCVHECVCMCTHTCVCVGAHVCIVCVSVCMWLFSCVSQRPTLIFSCFFLHLIFWDRVFHRINSLLILQTCLAVELQGPTCLCSLWVGHIGTWCTTWLLFNLCDGALTSVFRFV